jgi:uncharacterized protein YdhG (YjbR/CyaY superfamily)
MEAKKDIPTTVDEYIAQFPPAVQEILVRLRAVVKESAPGSEEKISYQMAGYYLNGGLIWFGAFKHHIGIFPKTATMLESIAELSTYKGTKGGVHFSLDQPMPYDLIRRIVQVRLEENEAKKQGSINTPE